MQVSASRLTETLARLWPDVALPALPEGPVTLTLDSRQAGAGTVFVAVPGVAVDGRDFIDAALEAGARLVLAHGAPDLAATSDPRVVGLPGL
ncbi:MAG: Mur ligase domain-containing protein, partial [Halomonas sp.]